MAELFQKDRTVISRHIRNVFNEGELEEQSTCAKFAHMGHDGLQQYETVMYNLDVTDLAYWHLAVGGLLGLMEHILALRSQANSMSGLLQTLPKEHLLSLYCKIKNLDPTIKE